MHPQPAYPEERHATDGPAPLAAHYTMQQWSQEHLHERYWSRRQMAEAWDCTYGAAHAWLCRNRWAAIDVAVLTPSGWVHRLMVHAGLYRPEPAPRPGNPHFRDPEYQRKLCNRRWRADN